MDWDSHYMPPEHYEPSIEFDFYTFFDGIEVCYHWEEGYLTDEDGEEVDLETHPHADEIQAYIEQNLEISLPEDPHEEAIDNHIVSFVPQINKELPFGTPMSELSPKMRLGRHHPPDQRPCEEGLRTPGQPFHFCVSSMERV